MDEKKVKLLLKIAQNKETLDKILQFIGQEPNPELFLTVSVRTGKKVKKTKIVRSPFGEMEETVEELEELEVKERVDQGIVLGLANQWMKSLDDRIDKTRKELAI